MGLNPFARSDRRFDLDIQEGVAQDLVPELQNSDSPALVFVSQTNEERTKAVFDTLRRASQFIDVLIDKRQESNWEALIEALTPNLPLSPNKMMEAKMVAQAMRAVLESDDFAKSTDIAEIADFSKKNPSSQPNRWKKSGLIFAVPYKGVDLYPLYALDFEEGARPLPIMKKLLEVLADKDDWQKAFWFGSVNTYLKNKMPKELLKVEPEAVLRAAEMEAAGVQDG
jgi:hypothetical protein